MAHRISFFFFLFFASVVFAETTLRSALKVDQAALGEVEIRFNNPHEDLQFSKENLNSVLAPLILESKWDRLMQATAGTDWVAKYELERIGIQTRFDENTLETTCEVPLNFRRVHDLSLDRRGRGWGLELSSDPWSGYLNLSALQSSNSSDKQSGVDPHPFEGQAEIVQHFGPATLESLWIYKGSESHPWERGDSALLMDLEDQQTRIRLGDSSPLTMDLMSSLPAGGLHVYRQFGIDPTRPSVGLRSSLIQVAKASWMEIFVNKILIGKLRVSPGPLNLRDLPLLIGRNRVHVKLTDDFQKTEEFDVDLFFDSSLLGRGIHDFSYFVGKPWISVDRERQYQKDAFVSLMHRYGLTEQLTLGIGGQTYQNQRVATAEMGWLTPVGTVQTNIASSRNELQQGLADHWRFRTNDQNDGRFRNTRFFGDYEYRSPQFSLPSLGLASTSEFSSRLEGNFQTQIGVGKNLTYGGGYQWGQNQFEDSRFYRAGLQWALRSGFRTDLSFVKTIRSSPEEQWLLNLTWTEPTGIFSSNAIYDSLNHQTLLTAHKSAQAQTNDFNADVSWQQADSQSSMGLRADYLGTRSDWLFQHDTTMQGPESTHQTRVGLSTALAWTGGRVSLSRPIHDSFALLATQEMPPDGKLAINSGGRSPEATLESSDSLVLSNLTSYQKTGVQIDSTSMPLGYSLDREAYQFRPKYRGGVFVNLGLIKKVYAKGRLVAADGKPISFQSGSLYNFKQQLVSDSFFTDGEGFFVIDQIPQGNYQLKLQDPSWKAIEISLPESREEVNLGHLTVPREEGM